MRYDLSGLGPEHFEHLVQTLAQGVIGDGVAPLGGTGDGGRDAVFRGATSYPAPGPDAWAGYLVIQAKFRVEQAGMTDAKWLSRKLTEELAGWARRHSQGVEVPDYLILATNVKLTSGPGGGQEVVEQKFRDLVDELALPFKGWATWDRDMIWRLLDNNAAAREAYHGLITPGDLLAKVNRALDEAPWTTTPARLPAPPPELPREPRTLVGRTSEVARCLELLGSPETSGPEDLAPCVVITGAPGIGKSHLALHVARAIRGEHGGGQVLLDARASRQGGESLVEGVLRSFDPAALIPGESASHQSARLSAILAGTRRLVLIDDIADEDQLRELLAVEGNHRVIATSRSKLSGLTGEVEYIDLGPLAAATSADLIDRIVPKGRLNAEQVTDLAQICAGHPLALQIASKRIARRPMSSIAGYLEELADPAAGIEALQIGATSMGPLLELSYSVLSKPQQELIQGLGALPRAATTPDLAAAVTAASLDEVTPGLVNAARRELDALVEYSLIEQVGEDRFVMHEILHRFARLKSAELDAARRIGCITNACLTYARRAHHAIGSIKASLETDQVRHNTRAVRILDDDVPGSVSVLEMAHEFELWDTVIAATNLLAPGLLLRCQWAALQRLQHLLRRAGERTGNLDWQAAATLNAAVALSREGKTSQALESISRGSELARQSDNPELTALALTARSTLELNRGNLAQALPILRHLANVWRRLGDDHALASVLSNLAQAHSKKGDYTRAQQYIENSRDVARRAGLTGHPADATAGIKWHIAAIQRIGGVPAMAARRIEVAQAIGDLDAEVAALQEYAQHELLRGRTDEEIESAISRALEICQGSGDSRGIIRSLVLQGFLAVRRGEIEQAHDRYTEAGELAEQIGDIEQRTQIYLQLASIYGDNGEPQYAHDLGSAALELAQASANDLLSAFTLKRQAQSLLIQHDYPRALQASAQAAQRAARTQDDELSAAARITHAEALFKTGRWQKATEMLERELESERPHDTREQQLNIRRILGNIYAERHLYEQAESHLKAIADTTPTGSELETWVSGMLAYANLAMRRGDWAKAKQLAAKAIEASQGLHSNRMRAAAMTTFISCALHDEHDATAIDQARRIVKATAQLGQPSLHAKALFDIAARLEKDGRLDEALTEVTLAVASARQTGNFSLRGTVTIRLARINHARGHLEQAATTAVAAAREFERGRDYRGAAMALLHAAEWRKIDLQQIPRFVQDSGCGTEVRDTVNLLCGQATDTGPADVGNAPDSGTIHVADDVRAALAVDELQPTINRLQTSRSLCRECGRHIEPGTSAELVLERDPGSGAVYMRATHPPCLTSQIIDGVELTAPIPATEAECIAWHNLTAAIVIDCKLGYTLAPDGTLVDRFLLDLRTLGFTDVRLEHLDSPFPQLGHRCAAPRLTAHIAGKTLHVEFDGASVYGPIELDFYSKWYTLLRRGGLLVIFGRSLPGSYAEDPVPLRRAVRRGAAVGAMIPITIIPPLRNGPCVCNPSSGKKYKDCCGIAKPLLNVSPEFPVHGE